MTLSDGPRVSAARYSLLIGVSVRLSIGVDESPHCGSLKRPLNGEHTMKRLTIAPFLMACVSMIQAQTSTQVVSQDVTQDESITFTSQDTLQVVNSNITAVVIDGVQTTANLGTLSLNTAALTSGDLQTGATFGTGGMFSIVAPGYVNYTGTFTSAAWTVLVLADGSVYYNLQGALVSSQGSSNFICTTDVLPVGTTFSTSETLDNCSFGGILSALNPGSSGAAGCGLGSPTQRPPLPRASTIQSLVTSGGGINGTGSGNTGGSMCVPLNLPEGVWVTDATLTFSGKYGSGAACSLFSGSTKLDYMVGQGTSIDVPYVRLILNGVTPAGSTGVSVLCTNPDGETSPWTLRIIAMQAATSRP
jgi:hypothetical protein